MDYCKVQPDDVKIKDFELEFLTYPIANLFILEKDLSERKNNSSPKKAGRIFLKVYDIYLSA